MDKTIILLFVAHLLGDFIFQSEWMALNKGKWFNDSTGEGFTALGSHVLVYSTVLFITLLLGTGFNVDVIFVYSLANFFFHIFVDGITSQITSYYHNKGENRKFFNTIGIDQTIHYITLYITYYYILFLSVKHA